MPKKKYKARKGAQYNDKDAQVIGETIVGLMDTNGFVTSEVIVNSAKNTNSPIHRFFDWDNGSAARKFRLQQARDLVNHIVEVVVIAEEEKEQRSIVSVDDPEEGKVYVTLQDAIENDSYREQLLNRAITQLENLTITMKMFREADSSNS